MIEYAVQSAPAGDVRPGWILRYTLGSTHTWDVEKVLLTPDGVNLALVPVGRDQRASHLELGVAELVVRLAPPDVLDEIERRVGIALQTAIANDLVEKLELFRLGEGSFIARVDTEEWALPARSAVRQAPTEPDPDPDPA